MSVLDECNLVCRSDAPSLCGVERLMRPTALYAIYTDEIAAAVKNDFNLIIKRSRKVTRMPAAGPAEYPIRGDPAMTPEVVEHYTCLGSCVSPEGSGDRRSERMNVEGQNCVC
ncbi:hypothetical protein T265_04107 [Opisthorchis viverrini]|uniref:Uncharacterized protein n=1 Tax=Opisthorchis viverrini TaxID=6198 RepID=A0A074ZQA4_OPIVI|nr:hypothetical protein T265_04107 [Opisthorchis viverrini]KER29266.1 hypothetical protein T265_04107 [Opisthorchis viverrini]